MTRAQGFTRVLKPLLFLAALLPLAGLALGDLGANPVERLSHVTGDWALRLLLATLAMTPLRRLTGWGEWLRLRRMLGLFAFFYASLHLAVYVGLDLGFAWGAVVDDIVKRPYITLGFATYLILIPLAATSTQGMMRRLGKRWKRLHRLVYVSAFGGVLHYVWLVKSDLREPLIYLLVLLVLLLLRWWPGRSRRRNPAGIITTT